MIVHFIAIGGSAMHNLAIALSRKGAQVTGSDDEIFEPSRSRLAKQGILPENLGWDSTRISSDIDAVILGMHARADNPELLRANELGIKIFSYPSDSNNRTSALPINPDAPVTKILSFLSIKVWPRKFAMIF